MKTLQDELVEKVSDKFQEGLTYTGKNIKQMVKAVDMEGLKVVKSPTSLKKGDVISLKIGLKQRPCVIVKVLKNNTAVYLPLTTTENHNALFSYTSRFFREGWFSNTIGVIDTPTALTNFIGVFDNTKRLNLAIKEVSNFYKGIIW